MAPKPVTFEKDNGSKIQLGSKSDPKNISSNNNDRRA